jgi:hypothetical protein
MKKSFVVMAILVLAQGVHAGGLRGAGSQPCSTYLQTLELAGKNEHDVAISSLLRASYENWFLGFLAGRKVALTDASGSNSDLIGKFRNLCERNPTIFVAVISEAIAQDLTNEAK